MDTPLPLDLPPRLCDERADDRYVITEEGRFERRCTLRRHLPSRMHRYEWVPVGPRIERVETGSFL